MSYNPRIKNISGGTVDISGSLAATNVSTYVSASNANIATVVANSISASTVDSGTSLDITLKSVKSSIRKVTSSTSVQTTDSVILVDAASGSVGLTLPSASLVPGQRFTVKKVDSTGNQINVDGIDKINTYFEYYVLKAQNPYNNQSTINPSDNYGYSVATSGDGNTIVVGAINDELTPFAATAPSHGLVYIYNLSGSNLVQYWPLLDFPSTAQTSDRCGFSLAVDSGGNRIVVGNPYDEKVGGSSSSGTAYVYRKTVSNSWTNETILYGSLATNSNDNFGYSVCINDAGDVIAVSAINDEVAGGASSSGLVYVYTRSGTTWTQSAILSCSLSVGDQVGWSVDINAAGDRIVVGAQYDERAGGNGSSGLAYIFIKSDSTWREQQVLSGSFAVDASDLLGCAVSMNGSGDRLIVGAYGDETTGIGTGTAYIFSSGSTGWIETSVLTGSYTQDGEHFGYSVSMNHAGDRVVVGAKLDDISDTGSYGLVYVFSSGSTGWQQASVLTGTYAIDQSDSFGNTVAFDASGSQIVVGAPDDEHPSYAGNSGSAGLAYVYTSKQTIDLWPLKSLSSQNESVTVISDGTGSWSII
jgi:hypothetical protein